MPTATLSVYIFTELKPFTVSALFYMEFDAWEFERNRIVISKLYLLDKIGFIMCNK